MANRLVVARGRGWGGHVTEGSGRGLKVAVWGVLGVWKLFPSCFDVNVLQ